MTNREAFEKAAYNHYLQRKATGKIDPSAEGDGTPEAMFWRDENGNYGVLMFNAAWWGWQDGAEAAAQVCDDLDPLLNGDLGVAGACADAIRTGATV